MLSCLNADADGLTVQQLPQEKLHIENLKASNFVLGYIRQEWKEISHRLSALPNFKKTLQVLRSKVSKWDVSALELWRSLFT